MQSMTIDILNEKAINLLKELELLKLIRLRREPLSSSATKNWSEYKGAMSPQNPEDIEAQLKELREEWE